MPAQMHYATTIGLVFSCGPQVRKYLVLRSTMPRRPLFYSGACTALILTALRPDATH